MESTCRNSEGEEDFNFNAASGGFTGFVLSGNTCQQSAGPSFHAIEVGDKSRLDYL
jgi:hypothetical protein